MKKYLFYIILAVCIGLVIFLAQDSDEFSWLRAKLGDKSTDYLQYIKANPDGWHVFDNSYIVGEIVKVMKKTPINARQE